MNYLIIAASITAAVALVFLVLKSIMDLFNDERLAEKAIKRYDILWDRLTEVLSVEELEHLSEAIDEFEIKYSWKVPGGAQMVDELKSMLSDKHFQIFFPEYSTG